MKAIKTKYLGPTTYKGARIRVSEGDGQSIIVNWNYEFDPDKNHRLAAQALCDKFGWEGEFVSGWLEKGTLVHVFKG